MKKDLKKNLHPFIAFNFVNVYLEAFSFTSIAFIFLLKGISSFLIFLNSK